MNAGLWSAWWLLKWPWSIEQEKKERAHTHTHTQQYTPFLDLVRLVAGSHYLELWDEAGIACVRCVCVCMCVRGVSVKGCQCVEMCVCVWGGGCP